jgi:hypothetical protein
MQTKKINFIRENVECSGMADMYDDTDLEVIKKAYFAWKDLNEVYAQYGIRRANFPELLSEGLTACLFGWGRTNGTNISGLPSNSMDLINLESGDMIQLKACSTDASHKPGPTSFGPASEFDKLIFMHMDCATDTAYWYELKADEYKTWKVNRTETIEDQQAQGRRPRVTILPKIAEAGLTPIKVFKF